jgi:type I site-specific restriction endonuclease
VLAGEYSIVHLIADEAHRSQYDFIDGFARHMRDALPNACFIGFTGTPLELDDRNTRAVFGDYISIYDIQRAVEDGATVPIYYESRLAKLDLPEELKPWLDAEFEEVTEGEEIERKERLKTKWAQLEAVVGAEQRLKLIARDIVEALRAAAGGARGQGNDRLHEPAHLRRALPRDCGVAARVGRRAGRGGRNQGRNDRLGFRSGGLAAAHPRQATA